MEKKFEIKTQFDYKEYAAAVEDIALYYFNTEGKYQPHIGKLCAMMNFYNYCVEDSVYREKYGDEIIDLSDIEELANDKDFVAEFNKALVFNNMEYAGFDFGHAFMDAMEIVQSKRTTLAGTVELIGDMIGVFLEKMSETVNPESIANVGVIAQSLQEKGVSAESLINAVQEAAASAKVSKQM